MKDFVYVHSWFDQKYSILSSGRYVTFKLALNLLRQKNNQPHVVVETGTTRMKDDWGAGMSTVLFADYLSHYGGKLKTVDISEEAIGICRAITEAYKTFIDYVVDDSLHFLENYQGKIDLLYLDSVDYPLRKEEGDPIFCQEHQLKELKLALPKMTFPKIILLDDNDLPEGGKAKLSKQYLEEIGGTCYYDLQQSLWIVK